MVGPTGDMGGGLGGVGRRVYSVQPHIVSEVSLFVDYF